MMSRKHFIRISQIIKEVKDKESKEYLIDCFINFGKEENTKFDENKFIKGC